MPRNVHPNHPTYMAYEPDWCGAGGIVAGLRKVLEDHRSRRMSTAVFYIADHHTVSSVIHERLVVGIGRTGRDLRWRWCAANGSPVGAGSSTICDTDDEDFGLCLAVATVALRLKQEATQKNNSLIFRELMGEDW